MSDKNHNPSTLRDLMQSADYKYWSPVISHMSPRRQTAPTGREDREQELFYLNTDGESGVRGISQNKPKWRYDG